MVCAQTLPWRSALRSARHNARRIPTTTRSSYPRLTPSSYCFVSPSSRPLPQYLLSSSLSRPFATSPTRRKDLPPDDVPEPIPVKESTQAENQDQQESPAKSTDASEDSAEARKTSETPSGSTASGSTSNAKGGSGAGSGGESGAGDGGRRGGRKTSNERAIQKPSVPEVYPQVMAIPIAKRPLFPGFYKAVTIRDPNVAQAIQEMMRR
ncbi:MAG: hypothetical protein Q9174_007294, partial [Haloplaca sp. 1 TL-2023]